MLNIKRRTDLNLDNKQKFSICDLEDSKGAEISFALHGHEFFELELCTDGSGRQLLNGEEYEFRKGMLQLITTKDVHEVEYGAYFKHYNIRFNQENIDNNLLTEIFSANENLVVCLSDKDFERVLSLMKTAFEVSRQYYDYCKDIQFAEQLLKNATEIIIITIINNIKSSKNSAKKQKNDYVFKAIEYTEKNFMNSIAAESVAKHLGLNRNYFSSMFHKNTGKTYKKYLTEVKLNYARNLVCGTELSITEIAMRCGFGSCNSFTREFTTAFGASPLKYRKSHA